MKGKTVHEMKIGDSSSFSKTITDFDVKMFAGITGDFNPVHIDKEFAKNTMFKDRIAHGMLAASLFSTVLGTQLPGEGAIYTGQELKFTKPVYLEDTITATVTVTELDVEKNRVVLETIATNQNGEVVIKGFAKLMPAK
jgi:3-hydroxybutyryl-CoA dehydratase